MWSTNVSLSHELGVHLHPSYAMSDITICTKVLQWRSTNQICCNPQLLLRDAYTPNLCLASDSSATPAGGQKRKRGQVESDSDDDDSCDEDLEAPTAPASKSNGHAQKRSGPSGKPHLKGSKSHHFFKRQACSDMGARALLCLAGGPDHVGIKAKVWAEASAMASYGI